MTLSRRAVLAAGGGAVLLAAGCGDDEGEPRDDPPSGDLEVVGYALTLEYLEADFYDRVVGAGVLRGREARLARTIRSNERAHVDALEAAARKLGGPLPERPRTRFANVIAGGRDSVIGVAAELENTGAGAYLGAADRITGPDILETALAIHAVEGRHAAILGMLAGEPALPDGAFATALTEAEVMGRVERFLA